MEILNSLRPKRCDRWRAKSRANSSFSLTSRGLFTRDSSWHAKQSIPHTTVTFYGDWVTMWEAVAPNFGNKRTGCCIITTHRITISFLLGNLLPKTTWLSSPTHPTFLRFPSWNQNWKAAILTQLKCAVLNTFTEHDFQDGFERWQKRWNGAFVWKGTTLRVIAVSSPKSLFPCA
jgi:hypothetical protein